MGEIMASREYRFTFQKPDLLQKMANTLSKTLKERISPNLCGIEIYPHKIDSSRIIVEMVCVDGTAIHEADKNSMARIMQYCERNSIKHKVGDLQVKT